jgi:hypothetical protein
MLRHALSLMHTPRSIARAYIECAAFVLLWLAAEFFLRLTPLQGQFLGLPLILLFQRCVARRPLHQLWAFDAATFKIDRRIAGIAVGLAVACVSLLWLGRGHRAAGLEPRWGLGMVAVAGCLPAAFALGQQSSLALRRAFWLAVVAGAVRVVWSVAWGPDDRGTLIPAEKLLDFATIWLCEFTALFLFDEVAFRGALDPHLACAGSGRVHAAGSAVFVSILWAIWHLRAYNPQTPTFGGLFLAIGPFAFAQIIIGTLLSFCARQSRTLVAPCVAHAFCNAYVLALIR